jgi:hypothetical protein
VREREDANEIEGVVANRPKLRRNGAVGFIDWLGLSTSHIVNGNDHDSHDKEHCVRRPKESCAKISLLAKTERQSRKQRLTVLKGRHEEQRGLRHIHQAKQAEQYHTQIGGVPGTPKAKSHTQENGA